jgi:parallel beta-helix repeat protein
MRRVNQESVRSVIVIIISVFIMASFTEGAADTYYVATNGNNNNSCAAAQNINTPKQNIMGTNGGIACLQTPGDKLLIRQGTYSESINNYTAPYPLPSGKDWTNAFTVAAYPGETVTIPGIAIAAGTDDNFQLSYWIFDGLHVVNNSAGGGEAIQMGSPDHLRFINIKATTGGRPHVPGTSDSCVIGSGNFIEFINVEIHNCGDPTVGPQSGASLAAYGFYWFGSDTLFDRITLHDTTGYGFHIYNHNCDTDGRKCPDRNIIKDSEIYNTGTLQGSAAILFAYGDDNQAYGNTISNNSSGIAIAYGASNTQIYDNTITGNIDGIMNGGGWSSKPVTNTIIKNNIVADNDGYGIFNSAGGSPEGEPIGTLLQNNLLSNNERGAIYDTGIGTIK